MNRRELLLAPLALTGGCRLAARSGLSAPGGVLRAGHDNPPGHPVQAGLDRAAEVLRQSAAGRLDLQVFPSSQLGTQQEQLLATVVGSQDLYLTGAIWLAQYYPPIGVLESPYVFRDLGHMYAALRSETARRLMEGLRERAGVRVLDTWYLGRRHVTLVKGPARTAAELKGVKLRSPNAPLYIETVRALGADPAPMGIGEVYLALKTGVIDGQENPLPTIDAMKFYEVARYLVLTGHMITPLAVIANDRHWSRLPEPDREAVLAALAEGRAANNEAILAQEASLLEKFRSQGVTVVQPELESFRVAASGVARRFAADWGEGTYEALRRLESAP